MENEKKIYKNKLFYFLVAFIVNCLIKLIVVDLSYFYFAINTLLLGILIQYTFSTVEFKNILKADQMEILLPFWQIRVYFVPIIFFISYVFYSVVALSSTDNTTGFIHYYGLLLLLFFYIHLLKIEIPICTGKDNIIINKRIISLESISSIKFKPIKSKKNISLMQVYYGCNNLKVETVLSNEHTCKLGSVTAGRNRRNK